MNETIGVKGGHNDRRRSLKIKNLQKSKILEEEEQLRLKELEKRVKRQQKYTLIKTLPVVIAGEVAKTFYDTATGKRTVDLEEERSKWNIKEYGVDHTTESLQEAEKRKFDEKNTEEVVIVRDDGRKQIVRVPIRTKKTILDDIHILDGISVEEKQEQNSPIDEKKPTRERTQDSIPMIGVRGDYRDGKNESDETFIDEASLSPENRETLQKLKARKIVDEYERQLKDIRFDLRNLIFDYNVLVQDADEAVISEETAIILDKLSEVIDRVEELKRKIRIDDLDKYDDNYIYTLVEEYLDEFRDKKLISEIKDSPLYVLIAEKLEELDVKKDSLNQKVEEKKEKLEQKEEKFAQLREKYFNLDAVNAELLKFQYEQDALLKEVQEKVRDAVSVQERVQVEVQAMNFQSRRLLRMLSLSMFFPGARAAKGMAVSAAAYLYFMNQILRPRTTTRRYRVITVKDYSREIESSLDAIDSSLDLLGKTSKQIDKMITLVNEEFKDYVGVIKECDELLYHLRKLKSEMKEKEYEMEKIKKEQELVLEKNNVKVKTRGTYPM